MVCDVGRQRKASEVGVLVLAALADAERHGYAIIGEIRSMSGGRTSIGTGTLYGTLERLQDDGCIEASREETVEGRLRRYYRITDHGRGVLADEVAHQEQWVVATRARLAGA
jgi:DNA-binding PadR family transcriptional regulator